MKYASSFKVNLQEMTVIEKALNQTLSACLDELHSSPHGDKADKLKSNIREVNELLGSLHNQKIGSGRNPHYISAVNEFSLGA